MQGCDTLLMVGTGFPWSEFLPKDGGARAVQIDIEASMLSLRYPAEVNLHGDAADTLKALLPLIRRKHDRDWSKKIEANVAAWWEKLEGRATADADSRSASSGKPLLPANAIVISDSGPCANWFARDHRGQQGQSASLSGGLASMGAAVPYAIGAKFAHPDRPVNALVGDGTMQMNNMAELITVQKYWKRWSDPRWIVCVFNNQNKQHTQNLEPDHDTGFEPISRLCVEPHASSSNTNQLPEVRDWIASAGTDRDSTGNGHADRTSGDTAADTRQSN
jgi:pyruvate dehydrogenase (quinone)